MLQDFKNKNPKYITTKVSIINCDINVNNKL